MNNKFIMESTNVYSAFISGLPYDTTEDSIKQFFSEIGHITYLGADYRIEKLLYRSIRILDEPLAMHMLNLKTKIV